MRWDGVPLRAEEHKVMHRAPEFRREGSSFSQNIGVAGAKITVRR
jgi:hypothetical protein